MLTFGNLSSLQNQFIPIWDIDLYGDQQGKSTSSISTPERRQQMPESLSESVTKRNNIPFKKVSDLMAATCKL